MCLLKCEHSSFNVNEQIINTPAMVVISESTRLALTQRGECIVYLEIKDMVCVACENGSIALNALSVRSSHHASHIWPYKEKSLYRTLCFTCENIERERERKTKSNMINAGGRRKNKMKRICGEMATRCCA